MNPTAMAAMHLPQVFSHMLTLIEAVMRLGLHHGHAVREIFTVANPHGKAVTATITIGQHEIVARW
jgi:hypothetical protein